MKAASATHIIAGDLKNRTSMRRTPKLMVREYVAVVCVDDNCSFVSDIAGPDWVV